MTIEPDTKDWTWVLQEQCPECGFNAADVHDTSLGARIRDNAIAWAPVLVHEGSTLRPSPDVWSPTEYACHVRDVHRVFLERVQLMLDEDEPTFANWDQDQTAIEDDYASQSPGVVVEELLDAAYRVAQAYDAVTGDQWQRRGLRSNGSLFTVDTIGRYHLHDVVHHLHDVT